MKRYQIREEKTKRYYSKILYSTHSKSKRIQIIRTQIIGTNRTLNIYEEKVKIET